MGPEKENTIQGSREEKKRKRGESSKRLERAARRDFDQPMLGARESQALFIYFYKATNSLLIKPETRKKKREKEKEKKGRREEGGKKIRLPGMW